MSQVNITLSNFPLHHTVCFLSWLVFPRGLWLHIYLESSSSSSSSLFVFLYSFTGKPVPVIKWFSTDGVLLQDKYLISSTGMSQSELRIPSLNRSNLMKELICKASNTNLTQEVTTSTFIDLNCKLSWEKWHSFTLDMHESSNEPFCSIQWNLFKSSWFLHGLQWRLERGLNSSVRALVPVPDLRSHGSRVRPN